MVNRLSIELCEGTAAVHRKAERMTLIQALLRGLTDHATYATLTTAYLHIYTALEQELRRNAQHPAIAPLVLPELWRRQALQADLHALTGTHEPTRKSPAVRAYCQRIIWIGQHDPTLLVAHAYTRYLGDLAGGRILGRIVGRALDLQPGSGLDFYQFPDIDDLAAYREAYRKRLDALPIAPTKAPIVVAEARAAFACNMAVFAEFEGSALKGLVHFVKGRKRRKRRTAGSAATVVLA